MALQLILFNFSQQQQPNQPLQCMALKEFMAFIGFPEGDNFFQEEMVVGATPNATTKPK